MEGITYKFLASVYQYPSSPSAQGWFFVSLPKELSVEIRNNFKMLEGGWGRLKVVAKVGTSEWDTSIWFDTKEDTYLLSLNAKIRKSENISIDSAINVEITI